VTVIDVFPFSGIPVAVLGLGKSGLVAARALKESGADVRAWDDSEDKRNAAAAEGIPVVDLRNADWSEVTSLVISPGIPHSLPKPHPVAAKAKQANVEIISDIELLARTQREASFIGITGTNGKSTTTALLGHVLKQAGRSVAVGGNIGTAALSLPALGQGGIYVLEMSSYQLEITFSITFDVAVLLNITPDHLDRHGGMDGYISAKRQIFHRQTAPRTAVIGIDDEHCRTIWQELVRAGDQNVVAISSASRLIDGVYAADGWLLDSTGGKAERIVELDALPTLPGAHNWQNAAAAYAAARAIGMDSTVIAAALKTYPGLPHRQERVGERDGVLFVNDSKATNADAAEKALGCYEHIYWIAGGLAKEGGIASLTPHFNRIRRAYLIGEAADSFAQTLEGRVPYTLTRNLEKAVESAYADAVREGHRGAVVLLSPACASFDQFRDFEARGDTFRALVGALQGSTVPAGHRT
jgi:UDP-N-acetylmuramoylalanine--D-glutamate ligase